MTKNRLLAKVFCGMIGGIVILIDVYSTRIHTAINDAPFFSTGANTCVDLLVRPPSTSLTFCGKSNVVSWVEDLP